MFSIRRILDASAPANRVIMAQVQTILKAQFSGLSAKEIEDLPHKLNDPLTYRFQSRLLVAQRKNDSVLGFALIMYAPDLKFCYLDFMAAGINQMGQGLGGALYARVREEAYDMGAKCILLECLPDDPQLSPNAEIRKQNARRIAFYQSYGAEVITGTLYEMPVNVGDTDPPYLVIDALGNALPKGTYLRKAVRAILERKYGEMCDAAYIEKVVRSFPPDEITVRGRKDGKDLTVAGVPVSKELHKMVLIANDGHEIHHVKEHGYVESPVRIKAILKELEKLAFVEQAPAKPFSDKHILAVHDADYVSFLKKACMAVPKGKSVYPYVFPIRNQDRKPQDTPLLAGYYCIDTFTPLNADAYSAARSAVDCVLTGAEEIVSGRRHAYALVRPPGHHAERRAFGGFCYFSNSAIGANYLSQYGKVAVLDLDYHHGNGQQDIFYRRADVMTVSIHGHPKFAYPYFTGFADEIGEGAGYGFNLNLPLPEILDFETYLKTLTRAIKRIQEFKPAFLVVALGLDTAKADPTGTWPLRAGDFDKLGMMIGNINLPTLIVQEGGYRTQTLGINARHFFTGIRLAEQNKGLPKATAAYKKRQTSGIRLRKQVWFSDIETVRSMVAETGVFSTEELDIAGELVAEALQKGEKRSGYSFVFLEEAGRVCGYSCFGRIPLTESSFDLYWLVVDPSFHKRGFASKLLEETEQSIRKIAGTQLLAETSSRADYTPARSFYLRSGFVESSRHVDFYRPGDDKVTYTKFL